MTIVSSWEGNAQICGCYLWERGGVRRCSVIWKQLKSVVGGVNSFYGTTHISWKVRVRQFWTSFSRTARQCIQPSSSIDTIIEFLTNKTCKFNTANSKPCHWVLQAYFSGWMNFKFTQPDSLQPTCMFHFYSVFNFPCWPFEFRWYYLCFALFFISFPYNF
jgi:hypothetical protein